MASGIARGRVRTTTTTAAAELPNMAAILQKNRLKETYGLGLPCILDIKRKLGTEREAPCPGFGIC